MRLFRITSSLVTKLWYSGTLSHLPIPERRHLVDVFVLEWLTIHQPPSFHEMRSKTCLDSGKKYFSQLEDCVIFFYFKNAMFDFDLPTDQSDMVPVYIGNKSQLYFFAYQCDPVACFCDSAESCAGVQCGEGRRCVLKKGLPRCVCAPDCRSRSRVRGPVCGTDGRSYRTVCRLRKRACRKKASTLTVAYSGHCQSTSHFSQSQTGFITVYENGK